MKSSRMKRSQIKNGVGRLLGIKHSKSQKNFRFYIKFYFHVFRNKISALITFGLFFLGIHPEVTLGIYSLNTHLLKNVYPLSLLQC